MEFVPRITRAQVMDVLSSQANLAGYRAVIEGAEAFGKAMAFIEFDLEGKVVTANQSFLDLMGYGLEDIRGQHHH